MNYQRRLAAARALLAERGLTALLIGQPANRQYLSGFRWHDETAAASAGWVVLTARDGYFLTGFNHFEAVRTAVRHLEAVKAGPRLVDSLVDLLNKLPPGPIGFEGSWVTVSLYDELGRRLATGRTLQAADGLVEQLRAVKDADELAVIRRAIAITDRAYLAVLAGLRPGQTEREIAWAFERALRDGGADEMAFGPVVATGAHTAIPHHEPTDAVLRVGEPVWIDLGARVEGYCADLTRSFCLETASPEYVETWLLVLEAQKAALDGLRAGLATKEADALARDRLVRAGRGEEFGHALGHGVGLMIHEAPRLSATSDEVLRAGMVVTVEPGLYRAGWEGVRLEDVALIEPDGALVLSSAPKQPVVHLHRG